MRRKIQLFLLKLRMKPAGSRFWWVISTIVGGGVFGGLFPFLKSLAFRLALGWLVFFILTLGSEWLLNRSLSWYKRSYDRLLRDLDTLTQKLRSRFHYEQCVMAYTVALDQNDRWARELSIHPDSDVTVVKDMLFGIYGNAGKFPEMFEELVIDQEVNEGDIFIFPIERRLLQWRCNLFFVPVLTRRSRTRKVILRGKLEDTWKSLRQKEEDTGRITMDERADLLQIKIIFPSTMAGEIERIILEPLEWPAEACPGVVDHVINEQGQPVFTLTFKNAPRGEYRYRVIAQTFPQVVKVSL